MNLNRKVYGMQQNREKLVHNPIVTIIPITIKSLFANNSIIFIIFFIQSNLFKQNFPLFFTKRQNINLFHLIGRSNRFNPFHSYTYVHTQKKVKKNSSIVDKTMTRKRNHFFVMRNGFVNVTICVAKTNKFNTVFFSFSSLIPVLLRSFFSSLFLVYLRFCSFEVSKRSSIFHNLNNFFLFNNQLKYKKNKKIRTDL